MRKDDIGREQLKAWLPLVTPLQRRILILRFGLEGEALHSSAEIEAELNLSHNRLREEEREVLRSIRRHRKKPETQ